jgi:hypothetical protein
VIVIEHSQNRGAILSCATGQLLSMEECALPRPVDLAQHRPGGGALAGVSRRA